MFDLESLQRLYASVISEDIVNHSARDMDVQDCLSHMLGSSQEKPYLKKKALDFNKTACRLAYLHAYAPIRTEIAKRAMCEALARHWVKWPRKSRVLRLCSLGAGPGCDVIGLLSAFDEVAPRLGRIETVVTLVDSSAHWERTFASLLREIRRAEYGTLALRFSDESLHWRYVEDDLVHMRSDRVWEAVSSSSLVVMNHTLSVLDAGEAKSVIDNVLSRMAPGSFALIIDEADDALSRMILKQAERYHFILVHWTRNRTYSFGELKTTLYGHTGCHRAVVTTHLLKKSLYASERGTTCSGLDSQRPRLCEKCADNITSVPDLILKKSVRSLRCIACEDDFRTSVGSQTSCPSFDSAALDESEKNGYCPRKEGKVPLDGIVPRSDVVGIREKDESRRMECLRLCRCRLL